MKRIIILAISLILISSNASAKLYRCGHKPPKPMACFTGKFICLCDPVTAKECVWMLRDCGY